MVYNKHVEPLTKYGDCKKNLQEKIDNITAERDSLKKV